MAPVWESVRVDDEEMRLYVSVPVAIGNEKLLPNP